MKKNLTRRDFLKVSGAGAGALGLMTLTGCGSSSSASGSSSGESASDESVESSESSSSSEKTEADTYTYHTYQGALASNWNPHTWEMNSDNDVLNLITTPMVFDTIQNSETSEYQRVLGLATSITDVTADHTDDLVTYGCTLPDGETAEEQVEGYVYEIMLNPDICWEDGTLINADTYLYSYQQLLNPEMKNYRASTRYSGDYAIAGAYNYFCSGDEVIYEAATDLTDTSNLYIDVESFKGVDSTYVDADGNEAPTYVSVLDETVYGESVNDAFSGVQLYADYASYFEDGSYLYSATENESYGVSFDTVGVYKVDDYTIIYIFQAPVDYNNAISSFATELVYEDIYESCKSMTGNLITSSYGTSLETTMSYGPYKMESLQDGKQMTFVQNENWYGYETQEDGSLVSYTDFEVDGESIRQYVCTNYVIDVMDDDAAKQAFLKGELTEWTPSTDDLVTYSLSEQLYKEDQAYTERFFFNTNLEALQNMDIAQGNTNSVVMSNYSFRKAFSLCINREEWVGTTPGWKPAYGLLNSLYYYNIYEDPTSCYRSSDAAMEAMCDLYGIEYGDGSIYSTLEDAYNSITGYNLTEARELMVQACEELVADGLYTEGEDIYIRIAFKAGSLTTADQAQISLIQSYLNTAMEDSGFGSITLEPVGNLSSRYEDVPNGLFAIGFGAWGGAAFYPFICMRGYTDPDYLSVNEIGCYDPRTETLTLEIDGEEVTMTWQKWGNACTGTGVYANADVEVKLEVTTKVEEAFLKLYYCIPLASTTSCTMYSYQAMPYTNVYNIMYTFGGLRLMQFNYTDAEWSEFVSSQGGTLSYE